MSPSLHGGSKGAQAISVHAPGCPSSSQEHWLQSNLKDLPGIQTGSGWSGGVPSTRTQLITHTKITMSPVFILATEMLQVFYYNSENLHQVLLKCYWINQGNTFAFIGLKWFNIAMCTTILGWLVAIVRKQLFSYLYNVKDYDQQFDITILISIWLNTKYSETWIQENIRKTVFFIIINREILYYHIKI